MLATFDTPSGPNWTNTSGWTEVLREQDSFDYAGVWVVYKTFPTTQSLSQTWGRT
jgi:hypothetical protein